MSAMRFARTTAGLAGTALVAYHGWLLASQLVDGRLSEPWLLTRWIVGAGLVVGLVAIRRTGSSLWSHKAIAIWVVAALLHGPAVVAGYGDALSSPALPEAAATVVLQLATASAVLGLGLWLVFGLLGRNHGRPLNIRWLLAAAPASGRRAPGFTPPFCPRPPPHAWPSPFGC